jgi:hypothetical protein
VFVGNACHCSIFSLVSGETMETELFGHIPVFVGRGLIAKTVPQGLKMKSKAVYCGPNGVGCAPGLARADPSH